MDAGACCWRVTGQNWLPPQSNKMQKITEGAKSLGGSDVRESLNGNDIRRERDQSLLKMGEPPRDCT